MSCFDIISKDVTLAKYEVGKTYMVQVTHINSPHSFFVRPKAWNKYLKPLSVYFDEPSGEVSINDVIIYKSANTNEYIRGQIKGICTNEDSTFYNVFAMDYGFLEEGIPAILIKKSVHSQMIKCPPMVTECCLADCMPVGSEFSTDAIEAMRYFVGNEKTEIVVRRKQFGLLTVDLHNDSSKDIATILALTNYTTLGYNHNEISRLSAPEYIPVVCAFQYRQVKEDDVLHVRHILGKSLKAFYVSCKDDYKIYLSEKAEFTRCCRSCDKIDPEELKDGMPVAVYMFDTNSYERGVAKVMVSESSALVQFVDTGSIQTVPISRMKEMPPNFFRYRPAAMFCTADESQVWDNQLHNVLYPGYEFLIKIKKVGDGLTSPHVVNITKMKLFMEPPLTI